MTSLPPAVADSTCRNHGRWRTRVRVAGCGLPMGMDREHGAIGRGRGERKAERAEGSRRALHANLLARPDPRGRYSREQVQSPCSRTIMFRSRLRESAANQPCGARLPSKSREPQAYSIKTYHVAGGDKTATPEAGVSASAEARETHGPAPSSPVHATRDTVRTIDARGATEHADRDKCGMRRSLS